MKRFPKLILRIVLAAIAAVLVFYLVLLVTAWI